MKPIVVSYRRSDSAAHAGRIHDALENEFGAGSAFLDFDSIAPGEDFLEVLQSTVRDAGCVLVVIGPTWSTTQDATGQRRLDDPHDVVRIEVETALTGTARVIPVLVGGASMPVADELPTSLEGLSRLNAVSLTDSRFRSDLSALLKHVDRDASPAPDRPDRPRVTPDPHARPSLVVLPFTHIGTTTEFEFFADGVTEDLTTALARLTHIHVISRNSAFAYKGESADVRQVGEDLGVRYVLEGSVRTAGNRVRISSHLTDTLTGHEVWAERYDREVEDIFDLQDDITRRVAGTLEPRLVKAEVDRILLERPERLTEWELVTRSTPDLFSLDQVRLASAIVQLGDAVEIAPGFARAHSSLALAHALQTWMGWSATIQSGAEAALHAAQTAIAQNQDDVYGHLALGIGLGLLRRSEEAELEIRTAIRLCPNSSLAHAYLGIVLTWAGVVDDALEAFDAAESLSPNDPFRSGINIPAMRATTLFLAHRYDEALSTARDGFRLNPQAAGPVRIYAAAAARADEEDEAANAMQHLLALQPGINDDWMRANFPIRDTRLLETYIEALMLAGLPRTGAH